MRGVHQLVGNIEHQRVGRDTHQVTALPATHAVVAIKAFHKNQELGIDGEYRVTRGLCRHGPVLGGQAARTAVNCRVAVVVKLVGTGSFSTISFEKGMRTTV